jgi:hypothetical protein
MRRMAVLESDGRTLREIPWDPSVEASLHTDGFETFCQMKARWFSPAVCLECFNLDAVILFDATKLGSSPKDAVRISCGFPMSRSLADTGVVMHPRTSERLMSAATRMGRKISKAEHSVLVTHASEISCPEAKERFGTWRCVGPMCVACPHYRGLFAKKRRVIIDVLRPKRHVVGCAKPHQTIMRQVVSGDAVLGRI